MRPKVSRGIKSTQSTKNLAILGSKRDKKNVQFQIEQLDFQKLNSKRQNPIGINTCRTQISSKAYYSKNNNTDRQKKPLEPIHQHQNKKTYAQIQRQKNTKKGGLSRNGSYSRIILQDQENKWVKPKHKQYQQISSIDMEILQFIQQQNQEFKQTVAKLKKQAQQRELSIDFLKKTNDDLQRKLFEVEKQLLRVQEFSRQKQIEADQNHIQLESALKELQALRQETSGEKKPQSNHKRGLSKQFVFDELQRMRDDNQILIRQQQTIKNDIRNIRRQNVSYRRQIARLKKELIQKQQNWLELGERSSLKIADSIRIELKQFGEERSKQYQQMLKHYRQQIDFLREKNTMLQSRLQNIKQKQIKQILSIKRSFDGQKQIQTGRSQSVNRGKTHIKSRSMAMLTPWGLKTDQETY